MNLSKLLKPCILLALLTTAFYTQIFAQNNNQALRRALNQMDRAERAMTADIQCAEAAWQTVMGDVASGLPINQDFMRRVRFTRRTMASTISNLQILNSRARFINDAELSQHMTTLRQSFRSTRQAMRSFIEGVQTGVVDIASATAVGDGLGDVLFALVDCIRREIQDIRMNL